MKDGERLARRIEFRSPDLNETEPTVEGACSFILFVNIDLKIMAFEGYRMLD